MTRSTTDPRISIFAIIGLADISLQKTAKTARSGRGRTVPERSSGMLPAARVIPRTEPLGLSTCCAANFGETATLTLARRCSMPRLVAAINRRYDGAMETCGADNPGKTAMQPLRSFLFAPGNHARRVEKALSLDADAVILDLEDAVATAEKRATRAAVIAALLRPRRALLYVRVNAVDTEFCYGDLAAIVRPGLDGIILPKVESAAGLATADWLLAQLEREQGLVPRKIDLVPIIETARGLNQIDAILEAGTRVKRVAFGAGDLTLDVNMAWSRGEAELCGKLR